MAKKVTTLKPLQKLNRQAARSISSTGPRCPDHVANNFGFSGFGGGSGIVVVPPIFPGWTASSSRIRPRFGYFS
jgi:hypothetical protein